MGGSTVDAHLKTRLSRDTGVDPATGGERFGDNDRRFDRCSP
jgi:hypothetical protein